MGVLCQSRKKFGINEQLKGVKGRFRVEGFGDLDVPDALLRKTQAGAGLVIQRDWAETDFCQAGCDNEPDSCEPGPFSPWSKWAGMRLLCEQHVDVDRERSERRL